MKDFLAGIPAWTERAACAGVHPDVFFLDLAKETAREHCLACPVRSECLDELWDDRWAFAGGFSASERREMARRDEE